MQQTLKIALVQCNPLVGDIEGNARLVIEQARQAAEAGAQLVLFPELVLIGYPPEDLLLRPSLEGRIQDALEMICSALPDVTLVVGYPGVRSLSGKSPCLYNLAGVIREGRVVAEYAKQELPNYLVFDEKRYFEPGTEPLVVSVNGFSVGITICEDIWHQGPVDSARVAGAELLLNLNASPYHQTKHDQRIHTVRQHAIRQSLPVVYCNLVGGQDELVFDGGSFAVGADGDAILQAPQFETGIFYLTASHDSGKLKIQADTRAPLPNATAAVYQALVLGVRDYVNKNGFKGVVLGLSGGIDSALTLAIAVDALGPERVEAVMMPFRYTSQMSLEDAEAEARVLGVTYSVIPIEPMYEAFMGALEPFFADASRDTTEENLQSRCRGVLLMALSNKKGYLVLTTGNKSEMAVGYATLYGDMAGGFGVLKDVFKTQVYELSRYRNSLQARDVIPERVIVRPPSAELAPDQKDTDSLPDYDMLDEILRRYIEADESAEAIIEAGFDAEAVYRVVRLVDINEYKRRQSAVGPRVTRRGFGKDRRYPITNGWRPGK